MVAHKILFVQPTKREPILEENQLKKAIYKVGNSYPVLHFTDVGDTLWNTAKQLDANPSILAVRVDTSLDWSISIKTQDLNILAKCSKYKVIGYKPEDCVLAIDLNGKQESITSFAHAFASQLKLENLEIKDWKKFTKYIGISKEEAKKEWKEILEEKNEGKKKEEKKEGVIVAKTEEEILTSFKSSEIIYKVKIENKGKNTMLDVHIKPKIPLEFSIDNEELIIPKLEEQQSEVVVFNIIAEKEHVGVEISADVEYKDSKSDEIKKLQMKTRYVGRVSK